MSVRHVSALLGDSTMTWAQRRTRLQGWRGSDAEAADRAAVAQRIGPAVCAVGAAAGAALESPLVLALFAATAAAGATAANHPFESLHNRWAARTGRSPLPPNRAAKRLGCAIGVVLLGGAAFAYATGAHTAGLVLAVALAGTATFVAATGICVPSMVFTAVWGTERACAPSLGAGLRRAAPLEGADT